MESADQNRDAPGSKLTRQIRRAGELIGLYSGEGYDRSSVGKPVRFDNLLYRNFFDGVVENFDLQGNIPSEQIAFCEILRETRKTGKRVAGEHTSKVPDDVSFVIVFRGFYKDDTEFFPFGRRRFNIDFHDIQILNHINCDGMLEPCRPTFNL